MPTTQQIYLRDGRKLDYDELAEAARQIVNASDFTQQEVADRLDVIRTSVGKAVTTPGPRYCKLQMRILEELTGYDFEKQEKVRFKAYRRPDNGDT